MNADGSHDVLGRDGLDHPTGVALSDDDIVISNYGTSAGKGEVVKLDEQG